MRIVLLPLVALAACSDGGEPANKTISDQPGWSGPAEAPPTGKLDRSHAGESAPATAFEDPDGAPASLADFRGKPVLLNLWATWCAPCIAEMPTLDRLAAREKGRLRVLTVSQDENGRDKVEAFFARQGYRNLETWLDPKLALMIGLEADTLPTTVLYDARGREVWRVIGMEDWESRRAARLLDEARPEK
ncbi:MAG TPA: TlpA disulfide reductase family protein [Allosphingosinicella sp.]|jgi:thiol-disulfide isomerase/thioredoxin|nr:TlpA disulfide reductase family protein [Allosphingosinicella sp.]